MTTPFDITVTLNEDEVKQALAEYVSRKLSDDFTVSSDKVTINVGLKYEDRPGGSSHPAFENVKVKAELGKSGGGYIG